MGLAPLLVRWSSETLKVSLDVTTPFVCQGAVDYLPRFRYAVMIKESRILPKVKGVAYLEAVGAFEAEKRVSDKGYTGRRYKVHNRPNGQGSEPTRSVPIVTCCVGQVGVFGMYCYRQLSGRVSPLRSGGRRRKGSGGRRRKGKPEWKWERIRTKELRRPDTCRPQYLALVGTLLVSKLRSFAALLVVIGSTSGGKRDLDVRVRSGASAVAFIAFTTSTSLTLSPFHHHNLPDALNNAPCILPGNPHHTHTHTPFSRDARPHFSALYTDQLIDKQDYMTRSHIIQAWWPLHISLVNLDSANTKAGDSTKPGGPKATEPVLASTPITPPDVGRLLPDRRLASVAHQKSSVVVGSMQADKWPKRLGVGRRVGVYCSSLLPDFWRRRSGFNPRPGNSRFSHVGLVPDDAVGRWVFSGISRTPRYFIPALLHTSIFFIGSQYLDCLSARLGVLLTFQVTVSVYRKARWTSEPAVVEWTSFSDRQLVRREARGEISDKREENLRLSQGWQATAESAGWRDLNEPALLFGKHPRQGKVLSPGPVLYKSGAMAVRGHRESRRQKDDSRRGPPGPWSRFDSRLQPSSRRSTRSRRRYHRELPGVDASRVKEAVERLCFWERGSGKGWVVGSVGSCAGAQGRGSSEEGQVCLRNFHPLRRLFLCLACVSTSFDVRGILIASLGCHVSGTGMKRRGKREIPEKIRRPTVSSSTIPTCKNPVTNHAHYNQITERGGAVVTHWTRIREDTCSIPGPANPDFGLPWFPYITPGECLVLVPTRGQGPFFPQSLLYAQLAPSLMTSLSTRRSPHGSGLSVTKVEAKSSSENVWTFSGGMPVFWNTAVILAGVIECRKTSFTIAGRWNIVIVGPGLVFKQWAQLDYSALEDSLASLHLHHYDNGAADLGGPNTRKWLGVNAIRELGLVERVHSGQELRVVSTCVIIVYSSSYVRVCKPTHMMSKDLTNLTPASHYPQNEGLKELKCHVTWCFVRACANTSCVLFSTMDVLNFTKYRLTPAKLVPQSL
ncbi:hypothetical protein PR048_000596 [Dryococelus australis]|uniref:Uncharacterized protein n=1 Tax=Dryococelus australis TaxID=614101 RepID=A0ABQ9IF35_9NEOP|nr:hypothetical protein PR048_000596 [Dryococelus australis]